MNLKDRRLTVIRFGYKVEGYMVVQLALFANVPIYSLFRPANFLTLDSSDRSGLPTKSEKYRGIDFIYLQCDSRIKTLC
jgi:hypothetical protein